ncbi:hypothetical protein [Haloferax sp. ATB1]|uniref:hypothetical protein n=1 Tax=Haloferax sp. ATB1 TaxID=1508454 RepID=UPI001F516ACF|nr:hypothetical protein [Haloferax sp. ATB1]
MRNTRAQAETHRYGSGLRDQWVEPEQPTENAFQVTELAKREASTWADALSAFLTAHARYDGLRARFANEQGDEFEIPLVDAWGEEYSKKQYARAMALQRQMAGGDRPSGGESIAAWDSPATAMLTLTASSVPDGTRVPPVEHADAVHDSFSYDGVRDTLRNTMEYHLGLDADQWGYWLQAEPHGMGGDGSGMNACYTHLHVGVYFDTEPLGLDDDLHSVGSEFERVIDKHVEVCEYAGRSAHDYDTITDYVEESNGCISLNASVETWVVPRGVHGRIHRGTPRQANRVPRVGLDLLVGGAPSNLTLEGAHRSDCRGRLRTTG